MATVEDITSDETFNFKCSSCVNLKRNREAVKYCVECQGYCCQECVETHTAFVALKSHTLLDKVSFKSARSATGLPDVPTEICSEHEIKVLDMYCENHDVVGCTTCMALDHRSCTDVHSIPHSIETIFQISDAHKTFQIMQDKINALRKIKAETERNIEDLSQSKEKALNAIKDFRKEMRDILDNLEKESINEVEVEFRNLESILKEQEKKMESAIEDLGNAADNLQKLDGNKAQQFVLMKIAQKKIEGTERPCKSPDEQTTVKITFFANQKLQDFLGQVETFGKVTGDPCISLNPRTTAYSIKDKREMSIRLQSDSENDCRVHGACLTDDGMLLLADYNNKKLKRANIDELAMVDYYDLPAKPYDVCFISKQTAAVALSDNSIQFISLGNQMSPIRQLKLGHRCFGIAYKDDRLYVTEAGSSLYVHDMSGNLLQTISQNQADGYPFKQNQDIAFSDNGDKMFVADWHNGVVTLDAKGCHIETFGAATVLSNAHDVCSDRRGNLFVSGYGSHSVVQFSQDGKKSLGEVVKPSEGLFQPYCVCFYPCRNRLIVTLFPSDIVKIFDLQ
ncbi:uncharacterized protein LOC123551572 [Mercenaria mercenaria]|uniref:uncharacterized protein LOC123551572 n=1 Tax=Mercenaria mercenaria TaxID=6596 RepID=UPI00234E7806|nr:uncharacterized protein LOC123551572 [Mercenaria mercenaria]